MIGVSAGPILPAFGPVPTAVDMPVGVLRRKHNYKKKKKKNMQKEQNPTAGRFRAFIFEFAERADQLVDRVLIHQYTQVLLFLQPFLDKIGDKLCKRCKIDIEDPTTTTGKWNNLRKEARKVSTKDDSQMSSL